MVFQWLWRLCGFHGDEPWLLGRRRHREADNNTPHGGDTAADGHQVESCKGAHEQSPQLQTQTHQSKSLNSSAYISHNNNNNNNSIHTDHDQQRNHRRHYLSPASASASAASTPSYYYNLQHVNHQHDTIGVQNNMHLLERRDQHELREEGTATDQMQHPQVDTSLRRRRTVAVQHQKYYEDRNIISASTRSSSTTTTRNNKTTVHLPNRYKNVTRSTTKADQHADDDPHGIIRRFIPPHSGLFASALTEIQQGKKRGHWSWYFLPTPPHIVDGQEVGSAMNQHFALRSLEEGVEYLLLPTTKGVNLRDNYLTMMNAIKQALQDDTTQLTVTKLMGGSEDVPKLFSSLEFFERVGESIDDAEIVAVCRQTLTVLVSCQLREEDMYHRQASSEDSSASSPVYQELAHHDRNESYADLMDYSDMSEEDDFSGMSQDDDFDANSITSSQGSVPFEKHSSKKRKAYSSE